MARARENGSALTFSPQLTKKGLKLKEERMKEAIALRGFSSFSLFLSSREEGKKDGRESRNGSKEGP